MTVLHEAYIDGRYIKCTDGRSVLQACNPNDFMKELAERWTFIEKHKSLAEVERKLAFADYVAELMRKWGDYTGVTLRASVFKLIAKYYYEKTKPPLTVGELKPGADDRIRLLEDDINIYLIPESCENIDSAVRPNVVVMMYEKDNSLCLVDKSTRCEIVR